MGYSEKQNSTIKRTNGSNLKKEVNFTHRDVYLNFGYNKLCENIEIDSHHLEPFDSIILSETNEND